MARVDQIVDSANSTIVISRLTPVELISSLAIKVRTNAIVQQEAELSLRRFRSDIAMGRLEVFSIARPNLQPRNSWSSAMRLACVFGRLMHLQLAVALALRKRQLVDHFVAADKILCEVAEREGFSVINPELS